MSRTTNPENTDVHLVVIAEFIQCVYLCSSLGALHSICWAAGMWRTEKREWRVEGRDEGQPGDSATTVPSLINSLTHTHSHEKQSTTVEQRSSVCFLHLALEHSHTRTSASGYSVISLRSSELRWLHLCWISEKKYFSDELTPAAV